MSSTRARLVGAGKLVDPSRLAHIFVSPRTRARRTWELLQLSPSSGAVEQNEMTTYTEDIAEWDYGDYEGLKVAEIRKLRKERGLDRERPWDIWRDGCEGGEYVALPSNCKSLASLNSPTYRSMQQVSDRLDRLILQIREIQRPYMKGGKPADVLLVRSLPSLLAASVNPNLFAVAETLNPQVAHGLILRCFVKRWLGFSVNFPLQMMLAPGAIAVLRYVS